MRHIVRLRGRLVATAVLGLTCTDLLPAAPQVSTLSPSRQVTWDQLLEDEAGRGEGLRAEGSAAPDHGTLRDRPMPPGPEPEPPAPGGAGDSGPASPEALCPGFATLPSHGISFQGLDDDNSQWPPDTMGAVGPRHVMTMLNTQVRIQNRIATLTYSTVSLGTFWAGLTGPFDPKIYYDNLSGRWIAVCLGNRRSASSDFEIIVSSTNDPTGTWTSYHVDGDGPNTRWVDYPCIGINEKWVVMTANMFAVPGVMPAPSAGPKMWVFSMPDLLAGGTVTTNTFDVGFDPLNGFTLQPAVCLDANVADVYIVDQSGLIGGAGGDTNFLRMSRVQGTANAPTWVQVPGSTTTTPGAFAVQNKFSNTLLPGAQVNSPTPIDCNDARLCNVVHRNGHLYTAHGGGFPNTTPDRNAVYWYELLPSLPNPIVQSGIIQTGGPNAHYAYPSIAANCGNDVCIGFSATSPAISPSACYVVRLAGDSPGTTSSTRYIRDGRAKYVKLDTNSRNRWGDYSATVVDPLDDKTFWTLQEYSELPVAGFDRFGVQWAQITSDCQTPAITQHPQSQDICLGQPVTFSIGVTGDVAQYQWNKGGTPIVGATFYNYTIAAVTLSDAGQYTCTVIGLCSAVTSNPATLGILTAPVVTGFVAWPNATCPGDVASIIPAVPDSGAFPMTVTLQKYNGAWQDVPGRTIAYGDTFVFSPLVHDDTGDYRLKYTNACGNAYTGQHRIQVGVSFDQQPAAPNLTPCQEVVFNVVAQGLDSLSYQWRKGGTALVDGDRVSGANTSSLHIAGARYEDEAAYDCLVTDICETLASGTAVLALPTPTWVQRSTTGPRQRGINSSDVAWDALRRVAVIYGGYSANVGGTVTELNDTWEWDGLQWAQRFPAHNPGFRRFQKLAFDTNRNVVLLFGGYSPAGPVYPNNEVWGYDGNDWTLLSADTPSGPAQSVLVQSAVFDSARAKMIVITSPAPYSPYLNATWEFDSAALTWSLASTGTPIKWSGSAFAYDSVRHLTVGQTHGQVGSYVASTWTFNGASWTDLGIVTADRKDTCMAFDTTRRRAVIYSGGRLDGPSFYTTDTWAFDGAAWQQILPNMPLLPYDLVMPLDVVCDTARRAMVMVGQSQNGSFGDVPMQTWEYRYLDQVVFDRQPESQPLVPDGNATFEVVAAGYGLLSYQWWRDDQMLIDGPAPGGGAIAGAQTSALSLTGVQAADGGVYACEVSNGCGTAVSDDALLGTPAAVASWASVMTHGTLGELAIPLVEGADTVECRLAGAQHLIRVELTSTGGAPTVTGMVQAVDQNTAATFDAAAGLTDNGGGSYTLDLVFNPPLPTALDSPNVYGCYRIDLASNISGLTGDTDMRFNVVVGDVSADGKTLLNDFALTKLRAQVVPFAVDPGNLADIRKDISNDGQIVLNDVALTKLNQGNGRILTCP